MRRVGYILILLVIFAISVYAVDFWEFKISLGSIFNSEMERMYFEEYKKGNIKDLETWLIMASGVYDQKEIAYYKGLIDKIYNDIHNHLKANRMSRYDTAKFVLEYLHKNVFRAYLEKSTDIDQLFDTGYYNCVNSTAIYNIILRRLGFSPKVIQLPDHIFSVVYIDNYKVEVETTSAKGFDVVRNPEVIKELKERTSYVYLPEGKGFRVEIGDEGLIASMYANQVLVFQSLGKYEEIIKSSIKALILEPNLFLAYTNLRSAYIGLINDNLKNSNYSGAITLVNEVLSIFTNDKELLEFSKGVYYNYVLSLIDSEMFSDAVRVIDLLRKDKPDYYKEVRTLVDYLVLKWGKSEIKKKNYENIFRVIEVGIGFDRNATYNASINLLVEVSKVFVGDKDYYKAVRYHKKLIELFPEGEEARINLGYYYNIWGVDLMNSGNLDKAVLVFEDGILSLPDDRVLKQNASIAYAKLSQISYEKKQFENAINFINRAIELNPSTQLNSIRRNIYISWSKFLAFTEENFSKAKKVCEDGLKLYPNDVELKKVYDYVSKK